MLLGACAVHPRQMLLPEGLAAHSVTLVPRRTSLEVLTWSGPPPFGEIRVEGLRLVSSLEAGERPFGSRPASRLNFQLQLEGRARSDVACVGAERLKEVTWRDRRWVTPRVSLDCVISDGDGDERGQMHFERADDGRSLGRVRLGDTVVAIRSSNRLDTGDGGGPPWQVAYGEPTGYELALDDGPAGALDVVERRVAWLVPREDPESREALLLAVTVLALGHDRILGVLR
jgi:hypothetical protein